MIVIWLFIIQTTTKIYVYITCNYCNTKSERKNHKIRDSQQTNFLYEANQLITDLSLVTNNFMWIKN